MIRSPQAFLISLSLHMFFGIVILLFVVPEIVSLPKGAQPRYHLSLSHVLPAFSATENTQQVSQKKVPHRVEKKVQKRPVAKHKETKRVKKTIVAEKHVRKSEPVETAVKQEPAAAATPTAPKAVQRQEEATPPPAAAGTTKTDAPVKTASAAPASPKPAPQTGESYLDEHLAVIAELLRKKLFYPELARRRHIEGVVTAAFTLQPDGSIGNVSIKKHAHAILDRAAVRTIKSLAGLMPHPQRTLNIEVPIRFVLR
jgi:periplasmic protein TonB